MDYFEGLTFLHWIGREQCPSHWVDKHLDGYYTLQYIHSGRIDFIFEGKSHVIQGPAYWLAFPGPRFQFGTRDGRAWHHHYCAFRGPRMKKLLAGGLFPIDRRPPFAAISEPEIFHAYFDQLIMLLDNGGARTSRAVHMLEGLLLYLHENKTPDVKYAPHAGDFRGLAGAIRNKPENAWNFKAEAHKCNLSEAHFRRIFRAVNSCSPARFLNQVRLARGAELLRTTNLPVKTIAEKTGFYDVYYFSKLFHRHYFMAPGKYRREFMAHDFKSGQT